MSSGVGTPVGGFTVTGSAGGLALFAAHGAGAESPGRAGGGRFAPGIGPVAVDGAIGVAARRAGSGEGSRLPNMAATAKRIRASTATAINRLFNTLSYGFLTGLVVLPIT